MLIQTKNFRKFSIKSIARATTLVLSKGGYRTLCFTYCEFFIFKVEIIVSKKIRSWPTDSKSDRSIIKTNPAISQYVLYS